MRRFQKGLDWYKENRSINTPVELSRDLNTNNPNSTADAEQVHRVKEVARLTCWPLLPLDKTEQWARWITESAGCNWGSVPGYKDLGRIHNDLIKLQWVFLVCKEKNVDPTPPPGLAGTEADFPLPLYKSTYNYKIGYLHGSLLVFPTLKILLFIENKYTVPH